MTIAADIRTFLEEEILPGQGVDSVGDEDDLLALGIVDSHGFVELVTFIEERFDLVIDDADFTPENFSTIARIERFLARSRREPVNGQVTSFPGDS